MTPDEPARVEQPMPQPVRQLPERGILIAN
jgi:hypothetical protein